MRRYILAIAVLGALVPTTGQAREWWQGIWAAEPEWCAAADQVGSVTPAPIAITEREVLGYENSCDITSVKGLDRAGVVYLRLECQSEGSTYDEDRVLMRTDETGLAIWIWFGSGDPVPFSRCK